MRPNNRYEDHQNWIHDLPLPVVGAVFVIITRRSETARARAYKLLCTYLTGYDDFNEDENDDRYLGTAGITTKSWEDGEEQLEFDEAILDG